MDCGGPAEPTDPGHPSLRKSLIVFLCFGGFSRLFGIVRSVGGNPMPRRARLRASLATFKRGFRLRGDKAALYLRTIDPEVSHAPNRNAFFLVPAKGPAVIVVHHNLPD